MTALTAMLAICPCCARAEGPWQIVRKVADFDRFELSQPDAISSVRKNNELKIDGRCLSGAIECDIEVPETGWFELLAEPDGGLNEFIIDGRRSAFAGDRPKLNPQQPFGKVDNIWLAKGKHTIRVQRYVWWGFWPRLRSICLRKSDSSLGKTMRLVCPDWPGEAIVRKGQDLNLALFVGGRVEPGRLRIELQEKASGRVAAKIEATLPAGGDLQRIPVALHCPDEGEFAVKCFSGSTPVSPEDFRPINVYVVDATPIARPGGDLKKTLLEEIDCAAKTPDYVSGGKSTVVSKPCGKYRLSGDVGYLLAQHRNAAESWYAYKLSTPAVGKPHVLEVDYPDDDMRTFVIALRENSSDDYPTAGGVDSGGAWPLSGRIQTQSIIFWPKTSDPRVALMCVHNGLRAAAARIRVYRIDGEIPPLDVPVTGGRTFFNYYEEGGNFAGFFGGSKANAAGWTKAAENWPRELAYMGGNMLIPTVSVYQMNLYPSRFNRAFAEPTGLDVVRLLLLKCEKFGVKLAVEFHPAAGELDAGPELPKQNGNGLVSKTGAIAAGGPMHHPLDPRTEAWYLGMIGEAVDRYKDSPAFAGVSLRAMTWVNPSLNNFHSLDWGYDDLTIGLFQHDTGLVVPGDPTAPDRFAKRYDWLMAHARQRWIDWRCEKIAELHRKIVARVRRARPDLRVCLTNFDMDVGSGLDPKLLTAIDGLVLVNCKHSYGRRALSYEGFLADQKTRDRLIDPACLHELEGKSSPAAFLFAAGYVEGTERVLKPVDIGFPAECKKGWISGVLTPAGRACIERYAVALAETDAFALGDGGNTYTLGQPLLREFNREFRRLPRVHFDPRKDARDPVAVWELARNDGLLFYAVNREGCPARLAIALDGPATIRRLATGELMTMAGNRMEIELAPYQLMAFQASAGTRIASATATLPEDFRNRVQSMVQTLEKLAKEPSDIAKLGDEGRKLLGATLVEARQCLAEGRYWRARTMLENHRLAELVYNPTRVFPPGLSYLIDPRK
jgi:hypothetical protein